MTSKLLTEVNLATMVDDMYVDTIEQKNKINRLKAYLWLIKAELDKAKPSSAEVRLLTNEALRL